MMDSKEKELIAIIGNLNSEIYDLKQNKEKENSTFKKNMINFVNFGNNSPMMSTSAVDFIETERIVTNETYENEIQLLNQKILMEKESSKNAIESLQEKINIITAEKAGVQSELENANIKLLHLQKLFEEQKLINSSKQINNDSNFSSQIDKTPQFELILKENEQLKIKVNDLTNQIQIRDNELQQQIQSNQTEREEFYAEIKRLTENSISNTRSTQVNSNRNLEPEPEVKQTKSEITQLQSNLAYVNSALQKAIAENTRLTNYLHMTEKECSKKVQRVFEECAQYKAAFTSLQSLFNTDNRVDIMNEVTELYQKCKNINNNDHLEQLLKEEKRKNEELHLMLHMGARISSQNQQQSPPSSPQHENKPSNDGFLFQERIAQLEAEGEELSRTIENANKNADALRNQIEEKNHIIEENEKLINSLRDEADSLRGAILSKEEELSHHNNSVINNNDSNSNKIDNSNVQANESEMKELLALVESLREENEDLRLTIGRKESGADMAELNSNSKSDQESNMIIQSLQNQIYQTQQKILHIASVLKQTIEVPTPVFLSFIDLLEKVAIQSSNENDDMNAFVSDVSTIAGLINIDYKTLSLVQNQCVSAYDQMTTFYAYLKKITDEVENFYCGFDALWETVCSRVNMDQDNFIDMDDNANINNNFDANMNEYNYSNNNDNNFNANTEADGEMSKTILQKRKKSPKTPTGNSSFHSLLDSPKIYRNTLLDQNDENINNGIYDTNNNFNDTDGFTDVPSLGLKTNAQKSLLQNQQQTSSISSSKIPKASMKNSKSRIPLSCRQNTIEQKMYSPKQAPSHIPELPSKKKNKFA